jgi:hypothetical protein
LFQRTKSRVRPTAPPSNMSSRTDHEPGLLWDIVGLLALTEDTPGHAGGVPLGAPDGEDVATKGEGVVTGEVGQHRNRHRQQVGGLDQTGAEGAAQLARRTDTSG